MANALAFNGGTSQINFNGLQTGAEFPFLNVLKTAQTWAYVNGGAIAASEITSDGYPSVLNGGGWITRFYVPIQSERSGDYKVTWTGTGNRVAISGGTVSSGADTASGYTFTPTDVGGATDLKILILGGGGISNLQVFHVNDEASLTAGNVFGVQFKSRLAEANFGVYRFMNWQDGSTNGGDSNQSLWAHRKPITYVFYRGEEYRAGLYVSSAATLSNKTYSCSSPGTWAGLVQGSTAQISFASASPVASVTCTFSGANITATAHGCLVDDRVRLSNSGGALPTGFAPLTTYWVKTVADANTMTLSATQGGTAIVASGGSGTHSVNPMVLLNVGSTGAKPMLNHSTQSMRTGNNTYPVTGKIATVVYDSTLEGGTGAWIKKGGDVAYGDFGLANGVPPEIMMQLCAEMGAHPYFVSRMFSLDPIPTDGFMRGLATYCQANAPSWMIPRFEGVNEVWNSATDCNSYAIAKAVALGWASELDWHGKAMSLLGQDIASIYGVSQGNVKTQAQYQIIMGLQTVSLGTATSNNAAVDSTQYVAVGGSAAKNWITTLCCAQYITPNAWFATAQEADLAARYAAGDLSASISYSDTCLGPANVSSTAKQSVADHLIYIPLFKTYAQSKGINRICGYEGGLSPDYVGGESAAIRNLKIASKNSPNNRSYLIAVYTAFTALTDSTFTAEFPSQYLMGDPGQAWPAFGGSIYSANTPAWNAIVAWGAVKRAANLRLRIHG